MFKEWGAAPSPMSFSELFSALQQGVMDGQENPLTDIYAGKLYEVQKYLSLSNHVYSPTYLLAGKSFWDKLPPAIQMTLENAALEIENYNWKLGNDLDQEILVKLEAKMKVNKTDTAAFQEASKPVYDELKGQVGEDFFNRVIKFLQE
jgi:TRAP-type C4-dicarboxylate transport system substrate-binding protein